ALHSRKGVAGDPQLSLHQLLDVPRRRLAERVAAPEDDPLRARDGSVEQHAHEQGGRRQRSEEDLRQGEPGPGGRAGRHCQESTGSDASWGIALRYAGGDAGRVPSFRIASQLRAPAEQVWAHATSMAGINHELAPLLRMTHPPGMSTLGDLSPPLGT